MIYFTEIQTCCYLKCFVNIKELQVKIIIMIIIAIIIIIIIIAMEAMIAGMVAIRIMTIIRVAGKQKRQVARTKFSYILNLHTQRPTLGIENLT